MLASRRGQKVFLGLHETQLYIDGRCIRKGRISGMEMQSTRPRAQGRLQAIGRQTWCARRKAFTYTSPEPLPHELALYTSLAPAEAVVEDGKWRGCVGTLVVVQPSKASW